MEARWRAGPDPQGRRRGAGLLPRAQRRHPRRARAASTWPRALPARELILEGEVIALRDDGTPASLPDHHDAVRPPARRRARPRVAPAHACSSSTSCISTASPLLDEPYRAAARSPWPTRCRRPLVVPRLVTSSGPEAAAFLAERAGAGPRGHHGEGAGCPLRGRAPRPALAQDQAGEDARPRGAGGGVGTRPAEGLAQQPSPRRARPGGGGFVMLGKTFKGMTDEMLGLADGAAAGARGRARRPTPSTCGPSWWWRWPSTTCRPARSIPAGVALRFARVKRYRPDKQASEADTIEAVKALKANDRPA